MKTIVVTGANGYIGSHVVNWLVKNTSYKIIAVDFNNKYISKDATFVQEDILTNCEDLSLYKRLSSPDVLLHLAWRDGFKHMADSHLLDLPKHFSFCKNIIESGVKNLSIMGSMHEIGYYEGKISDSNPPATFPMSYYAIAKNSLRQALFTLCADKHDISLKWLRGFYIMGDDKRSNSIFSKIIQWEKEGKKTFPFTDGIAKYDFLDVQELAEMISIAGVCNTKNKEIINISSGMPVSLKEKVEQFLENNNFSIIPEYGAFPKRKYDSPIIYGENTKIKELVKKFYASMENEL